MQIVLRCACVSSALIYPSLHFAALLTKYSRVVPRRFSAAAFFVLFTCLTATYGWHKWPETSYRRTVLHQMAPQELKEATLRLGNKLVELQVEHDKSDMLAMERRDRDEAAKADEDFRKKYYQKYFLSVQSVNEELRWRLHMPIPSSGEGPVGIYGMLVGPRPLVGVAAYLNDMASRLD